jgi:3-methyladenine DNA glycosylase/8-oxoguanine DNA glycosylase
VAAPATTRTLALGGVDPTASTRVLALYASDPTTRRGPGFVARAVRTPAGPGTVLLAWDGGPDATATAWGPAAAWLLDAAPGLLGLLDDLDGWNPAAHPIVADLARRRPGHRLAASGVIWQELALAVLGQRVTVDDAVRSYRTLAHRYGGEAPGPLGLRLPPDPEVLAGLSYVPLHTANVERRRADALRLAARHAARLEEAMGLPIEDALRRLTAVPGLGSWTATTALAHARAHPDVVVLGDLHLPTLVSYTLTGERTRVDDERMLELLEPFAGHRWRVCRLLVESGLGPGRRAPLPPRLRLHDR